VTSVRFTPEALDQIEEEDEWWRTHRLSAPELFLDELETTIERLVEQPRSGKRVREPDAPALQRVLLRKTRRHVYFVYNADQDVIAIHSVWGAVQGSEPDL
jgi:plasmid stabilization system protein ParE